MTFGACGYETPVWLNGHPLRTIEGEEIHYGEFNSFSFELPPEFLQTVNRLTVRIADSMDGEIPRGKQESRVYKRGGIWYQTISGSVRSVLLEPVERNRLRSRLSVVSSVEDSLVEFDITTRVHDAGLYTLRLMITRERGNEVLGTTECQLPLEAGERPQRVALQLPDAQPWSPAEPNLYHIVAELIGPSGSLSGIETHFGLRKIEARGSRIYLNNEAVYLDGILYQLGTSTLEEMRRYMLAMKRGTRTIRTKSAKNVR
jgi:beta-galactosidase/beta-glucuronidase